jgi:hypothetical protein
MAGFVAEDGVAARHGEKQRNTPESMCESEGKSHWHQAL